MEALFIIHPDFDLCMLSAWQWNICFFLSKLSIKLRGFKIELYLHYSSAIQNPRCENTMDVFAVKLACCTVRIFVQGPEYEE